MGRLIDADNIEYYLEEGGSVVAFKADIDQIPTADIDTDSAYAEGWTAAESKYRAMMSDGDCINRQAAIDAMVKYVADGYAESPNDFEGYIGIVKELPSAQPEQQWIPCSETENLPEHEVLCCDRYGEELIGWLSCKDDQWLCESEGEMMYDPIAWREKPEPWRGEEP